MNDNSEKLLLKPAEAARMLSISQRTLFQLRRDGHIPAVRFGGNVRYYLDDLREFCKQNRSGVLNERSLN